MTGRTLVAGVGNIFQRDDAFGVEVIRLLADRPRPAGVQITDFGIRGVHLVYELLNGCDLLVLIDAAQRGYEPGTVTVLEVGSAPAAATPPAPGAAPPAPGAAPPTPGAVPATTAMDAHGLVPDQVLAMLASMGCPPGRSLLVACEPADVSAGMGLSEQVRGALPHAVRAVEQILEHIGQEKGADDGVQAD